MKQICRILTIAFMVAMLPTIASAQYWDDLYIRPGANKQEKKAQKEQSNTQTVVQENFVDPYVPDEDWDVDTYNRRYAPEVENSETETPTVIRDTVYVATDGGYYLNGFYGSQSDLEYAERIRRFHNPKFTIHISDPAYTDLYYLNSWDWNVYIDAPYAYVTPTWTNPMYWDYMWSPYSYRGPSWYWYSPYYAGWYSPYYSWGYYPYPPHHHPGYAPRPPHHGPGYGPRPPHRPNYKPAPQNRPSYSPGGWETRRPDKNSTVARPTNNNDNRVYTNPRGERVRSGNTSRSSQGQSTTRQVDRQRSNNSRNNSGYTPSNNSSTSRSNVGSRSNSSSRSSSISSGSSGSSRGSMGGGSRGGGGGGGSRSRR